MSAFSENFKKRSQGMTSKGIPGMLAKNSRIAVPVFKFAINVIFEVVCLRGSEVGRSVKMLFYIISFIMFYLGKKTNKNIHNIMNISSCPYRTIIVLVCFLFLSLVEDASCDVRCKCICPKEPHKNTSNIFVNNNLTSPEECVCGMIVRREETYCLKCECKFETRNTTLIKVIVIFVIVAISLLYIYMALVTVQAKRRKATALSVASDGIQEHFRETASTISSGGGGGSGQYKTHALSISSLDRRMSHWQNQLDEQRNNVYGAKAVLN